MINSHTNRIFKVGAMIGQDDILFQREREHTYKAVDELYTIRLEKDIFQKMLKEFPDIKAEILEESNLRSEFARQQIRTLEIIMNND